MKRVKPTRLRLALAVAQAAAAAALALSQRATPSSFLPFGALAFVSLAVPWFEWTSPPLALQRRLPRVHGIVLLTVATIAWFSRSLALLELPTGVLATFGGLAVAPISLAFALAPRAFAAGATLVPSIVCLLGLAGLEPYVPSYGRSALPFLGGAGHTAFAEVYLAFAVLVLLALWTAALAESGPRWSARDVAAQLLAGALVLALAVAGVAGLPTLQPHVERAVVSLLDQGQTGLSGQSVLGEFAQLAVSRRLVLDLQVEPLAAGAATPGAVDERWLLRSGVFTVFDGRRWTIPARRAGAARILQPGAAVDAGPLLADAGAWFHPDPALAAAGPAFALRINQHAFGDWPLLLPRSVSAVVAAGATDLPVDRYGSIRRPGGLPVQLYGAVVPASRTVASRDAAGSEGPVLSDEERDESLALPPKVHPRVRALALEIATGRESPRARLDATIARLQDGYSYTLAPGRFVGDDVVDEFLFEKKAGYCEYFATAAVVLLRLQGVPARYVKGLSAGPQTDQGGGLHVVRESDAHAWLEAWIPGEGWVEADPTPAAQFAAAHGRAESFQRLLQHIRAASSAAWARLTVRGPASLLRQVARELAPLVARIALEPAAGSWLSASPSHHGSPGRGSLARVGVVRRRSRRALPFPPSFEPSFETPSDNGSPWGTRGPPAADSSNTRGPSAWTMGRAKSYPLEWRRRRAMSWRPTTARDSAASRRTRPRRHGSAADCAPDPVGRSAVIEERLDPARERGSVGSGEASLDAFSLVVGQDDTKIWRKCLQGHHRGAPS